MAPAGIYTLSLPTLFRSLGVKDVILPGEIRELVNEVVEAERVAKANLIRRQEETAATRSLRSEEHTSELQSRLHLVCRLLLEKTKLHFGDNMSFFCTGAC